MHALNSRLIVSPICAHLFDRRLLMKSRNKDSRNLWCLDEAPISAFVRRARACTPACVRVEKVETCAIIAYLLLSRYSLTCQPAFHLPHPHLLLPTFCAISLLSAKQRRGSLISLTRRRNKGSSAIASPFMCSLLQSMFPGSAIIVDHF